MKYLKINPVDNVAVALEALHTGEIVNVDSLAITINADIPMGHKFALANLNQNENIVKYGYAIGHSEACLLYRLETLCG